MILPILYANLSTIWLHNAVFHVYSEGTNRFFGQSTIQDNSHIPSGTIF